MTLTTPHGDVAKCRDAALPVLGVLRGAQQPCTHILPPQLLPGAVTLSGRCVNTVPHCGEGPLKALNLLCRWPSCAAAGTTIE